MVQLLLGLPLGNMKFCCFLCEWDSRARRSLFKGTAVTPTNTDSGTNKRHPHQSFREAEGAVSRVFQAVAINSISNSNGEN
jgi:hypothetical protein